MDQSNCSNDIKFALHNLPKGRTNLSSTAVNKLTWEVDEKGSFQVDSYKTIEQTDTLAGTSDYNNNNDHYFLFVFRIGFRFEKPVSYKFIKYITRKGIPKSGKNQENY